MPTLNPSGPNFRSLIGFPGSKLPYPEAPAALQGVNPCIHITTLNLVVSIGHVAKIR
jgi:hypothetical protein